MENALRKRLEILKSRAQQIRRLYLARQGLGVPIDTEPPCTLIEAAPGEEIVVEGSPLYLVRTSASNVLADAPGLAGSFLHLSRGDSWRGLSLRTGSVTGAAPRGGDFGSSQRRPTAGDFCFFDIETTGLTPSTYVFLCGMMYLEDDQFVIDQAFARDYSEEVGMLRCVRETLNRYPVLVTFNGASFDVPFVKARMAVGRIEYEGTWEHVDLLMPARQHLRRILPDCRLETIERHLRKTEREGDISGSDIPDAYHEFVRTGDARKIKRILYHNRMDLLAMVVLFNHLMTRRAS